MMNTFWNRENILDSYIADDGLLHLFPLWWTIRSQTP